MESRLILPALVPLPLFILNLPLSIARAQSSIAAWGAGTVYNPGDSIDYAQSIVPEGLNGGAEVITAGDVDSAALLKDGHVTIWGNTAPAAPPGLTNVIAVAAGFDDSLALKADGTVVAWGDNFYNESTLPPGLNNVTQVAAGGYHSLALKRDGSVVAWGSSA